MDSLQYAENELNVNIRADAFMLWLTLSHIILSYILFHSCSGAHTQKTIFICLNCVWRRFDQHHALIENITMHVSIWLQCPLLFSQMPSTKSIWRQTDWERRREREKEMARERKGSMNHIEDIWVRIIVVKIATAWCNGPPSISCLFSPLWEIV